MWERKRLLVWGKTYPEFSKKHYETVCTGAVDADTGRLLRIYPITLRYMKEPFSLFNWVEAEVERNQSDFRPESYKINQDSIGIVGTLGTKTDGWVERSRWVLREGNVFPSVRALQEAQSRDHTSLGLVKPKRIMRVYLKRRPAEEKEEWERQREEAVRQRDLFVDSESSTKDLVYMPVQYRAEFECDSIGCTTVHDMSILDWGVYALSRRQYAKGGAQVAERDVVDKIVKTMDLTKRDAHFFLGNTKAHPASFMIVGFFTPPRGTESGPPRQKDLPF